MTQTPTERSSITDETITHLPRIRAEGRLRIEASKGRLSVQLNPRRGGLVEALQGCHTTGKAEAHSSDGHTNVGRVLSL